MASRYSIPDNIHQFQMYRQLHHMQHQPGKNIYSHVFELQVLRDQLASCDPAWPRTEAAKVNADFCDCQRVWHLFMTVRDEFESVRNSLLHRNPLPKLDTVIKDLISEETCLDTLRAEQTPSSTDVVLATQVSPKFTPSAQTSSSSTSHNSSGSYWKSFYNYYKKYGHIIFECRQL